MHIVEFAKLEKVQEFANGVILIYSLLQWNCVCKCLFLRKNKYQNEVIWIGYKLGLYLFLFVVRGFKFLSRTTGKAHKSTSRLINS
jgi:hypothetical protein